jgi:hypothetical protein
MADIYLGLTESGATLLPPIRWTGGGAPRMPIDYSKQIDRATMLDGSPRYNFRSNHPRRWTLTWEMLTLAELTTLSAFNDANSELYFQNNWEDAVWRQVVIANFEVAPFINAGPAGCRYGLTMTLEEVL